MSAAACREVLRLGPARHGSTSRSTPGSCVPLLLVLGIGAAAPAAGEPDTAPAVAAADQSTLVGPAVEPGTELVEEEACDEPGSDGEALIDRFQRGVYLTVCGTASWFDGLFGTRRFDQDSDETFGRLGLFEAWDRRDDFDTRLRLRARLALPAMRNRLKLIVGRGNENQIVEGRGEDRDSPETQLPSNFRSVEDDAWLLGLGYSKQRGLRRGFDFGAGVRLRSGLDPYTKGTYRHNLLVGETIMVRLRETVFWRDSRGFGETTEIAYDQLLSPRYLFRWSNGATLAEDTKGFDWYSAFSLFQSQSERRGLAYTTFLAGETSADVRLQNYGFETRYRQRIARKWLFLELKASLTWPRYELYEEREINPGVGIGFEMYFGPVPELDMR